MKLKRTYSSREVASLTGLTARQLQLWDQSGLVAAAIPTHKTDAGGYTERRYTPIDLFELLVLADLRRRGFSVPQLRRILRTLKERFAARLFDATGGGRFTRDVFTFFSGHIQVSYSLTQFSTIVYQDMEQVNTSG